MKIIFQQYDKVLTIENKANDQDLGEMCGIFTDLLRGMGYIFSGEVTIIDEEAECEDKKDNH